MELSDKILKLLDYRIEQEEFSSRLYKSMAIWLDFNGYSGASKLWAKYAGEEMSHAGWVYSYLSDLNIKACVPSLEKPDEDFAGLVDIINKSYEHEVAITNQCQELAKAAMEEGDFLTYGLAQRFVNEQVEEIRKTTYWQDRCEAFGDSKEALRLLDNEMGE